ncbi:uncharacterized protein [Periplaneta americana]|uniref:uncharacterized protein isoform X2 n=1 Tax=Periplaneta americana TaxID=6978 RepID=UPI0037E7BF48
MRFVDAYFLSWWVSIILATAIQPVPEEKENETSLPPPPNWRKDQTNSDDDLVMRRHLRRRYRRPHIERVWIMRPVARNNISGSSSRLRSNFTDPIRSFAFAIRDPETFVRYLRQEESEQLAKLKGKNVTFNQTLPRSRYVQMEILSESESDEKVPILNMIVEQDGRMDTNSFMALMQQVAAEPSYDSWRRSDSDVEEVPSGLRKRQQTSRKQQRNRQQKYQQYQEQYVQEIQQRTASDGNSIYQEEQDNTASNSDPESEQDRKEQSQRKMGRRQREKHFRQRVRISEPLLIFGEYGQRNPNYSRPSAREFNRSRSHDILMAPSVYLLPPAESAFRHFNLPQNVVSFAQTPIPKPRDRHSLRRRKRPGVSNAVRPVDLTSPSTEVSPSSTEATPSSTYVYNSISPLAMDISLVSTDIPRISTDISRQSTHIPSPGSDISHVHIDIPRIYTSISRSYPDVSTARPVTSEPIIYVSSPVIDTSRIHITVPREPVDVQVSTSESSGNPVVSPQNTDLSYKLSTDSHQSADTYRSIDEIPQPVDIPPPATDISPPLPPSENSVPYNRFNDAQSKFTEEYEGQEGFIIMDNSGRNAFPNEVPVGVPTVSGAINQEHRIVEPNPSASIGQQSTRNSNNDYSSLMAISVDTYGKKEIGSDSSFRAYNNGRQQRKQTQRRAKQQALGNRISGEEDYDELQLTAAETAYYTKRQLTRRPFTILETNEETGSIPGVPGRDYPIYNRPPKTNFACVKGHGGYFADISTRCQVFFVCSDDGRGEPMLCPNGTLFNQDFLVCDWWFNVACEGVS